MELKHKKRNVLLCNFSFPCLRFEKDAYLTIFFYAFRNVLIVGAKTQHVRRATYI